MMWLHWFKRETVKRNRAAGGRIWLGACLLAALALVAGCASKPPPVPELRPVEKAISSYMGAPYRYAGSSRRGVDCSGLVMAVFQEAGVNLPHSVRGQYDLGRSVGRNGLRYGDVLFFNCDSSRTRRASGRYRGSVAGARHAEPSHNGVYIGAGKFVHASSSRGVVTDRLEDEYWDDHYIGARRYL